MPYIKVDINVHTWSALKHALEQASKLQKKYPDVRFNVRVSM